MDEKKASFLTAAYTAHKEEIMFRRRADVIMSSLGLLFYIVSMRLISMRPPTAAFLSGVSIKIVGTVIYVILTDVLVYFLVKNYHRLSDLQQLIVKFDTAFGFFEKDAYLPGETLYPESWKTSGTMRAWSITCRALILILFGAAVIAVFWLRQI